MKKHIKNFFIICILFISFVLVTATSYANSIFNDLSTNIFRLHIIANSDSSEDQLLKLKIRDSIINYMKIATKNANSKEEIINFCKNNLNELIERYKLETEDVKQILDDSNLEENEKSLEILHKIGRKRGAVISGGDIDEEKTAKIILDDFRSGKIGKITLEKA